MTPILKNTIIKFEDILEYMQNFHLKPKFDANSVDDAGPLFIDFSTRKLINIMIHYKSMQVKNYVQH